MDEPSILSQFDGLVTSGLVIYDKQQEIIEHVDGELKFQFLLTSALLQKPTLQRAQPQTQQDQRGRREGSDISTEGYEIGDIGTGTHFLVANKFSLDRPHLLLLTSDGHRKQYEPLYEDDLAAAWTALASLGEHNVVFFNCGQDGGCSRLHKHMQLMPMPKHSFASFLDSEEGSEEPPVPFHWFYHRFGSQGQTTTPADVARVYTDLLKQATRVGKCRSEHAADAELDAACPHNMILTRRWMLMIPRRRAMVNTGVGANAMGMLGAIAVSTREEIDSWVRVGLTEAMRQVGVPRESRTAEVSA